MSLWAVTITPTQEQAHGAAHVPRDRVWYGGISTVFPSINADAGAMELVLSLMRLH